MRRPDPSRGAAAQEAVSTGLATQPAAPGGWISRPVRRSRAKTARLEVGELEADETYRCLPSALIAASAAYLTPSAFRHRRRGR